MTTNGMHPETYHPKSENPSTGALSQQSRYNKFHHDLKILAIIQELAPRRYYTGGPFESKYKMACPLCNYQSRSGTDRYFTVSEDQWLFRCFVCSAKGNAFQLDKILRDPTRITPTINPPVSHQSQIAPPPSGTNLTELAHAKSLDFKFVTDTLKWRDAHHPYYRHIPVVAIPYPPVDGRISTRYRTALTGPDRFRWSPGSKPSLYGIEFLEQIRAKGWVCLVEGETDTAQLLQRGYPALGIPGVDTWKTNWSAQLEGLQVYIWQEPDAGGARIVQSILHDIPSARTIAAPPWAKDVCEMASMSQAFDAEFLSLLATATSPKDDESPIIHTATPEFSLMEMQGLIGKAV